MVYRLPISVTHRMSMTGMLLQRHPRRDTPQRGRSENE